MTGPKISLVMVTDLGSLVTMTVGLTKYPVDESATCQLGSNVGATELTITTGENLSTGLLGLFNDTSDPLERWLVDNRSSEMSPLGTWSNSDTIHLLLEGITESTLPH
jgi:hypothetical protein